MSRQHVHLSGTREQAYRVGARYGRFVVLEIDAKRMSDDRHFFSCQRTVFG